MRFWLSLGRALAESPIRRKLLISYLLFIAVPLILFSTVSYMAVSRYYEDQVWFSASQAFDQALTFLSSKVNAMVKASDIVYFSAEVQAALTRDRARFENNLIQQSIDANNLDNYLSSFRNADDVYRISLFVPGWLSYSSQGIVFDDLDRFVGDANRAAALKSRDKVTWSPGETVVNENQLKEFLPVVSMYRKIRDFNDLRSTIGVIRVVILQRTVDSVVEKAATTRDGLVLVCNSQGAVVSSSSKAAALAPWMASLSRLPEGESPGWSDMSADGKDYSVRRRALPGTDWTLVSVIPMTDIRYQSYRLRILLLCLVLVIGTAAYGAAALITRSTTRRLTDLTLAMEQVGREESLAALEDGPPDEIGVLTRSFRSMMRQIGQLLEAQYQAGQDLKSAELRALQAQINPHFLYNTLELINWQAMNKGAPEIAEISRALARFYALSLNNGRDLVTVEDELAHVETYVEIQNRRFDRRIGFRVEVPRALRPRPILKLLLQPLVENAILHGILERGEEASGRVTVKGRRSGADMILTVEDDGVGMTEDQLGRLLSAAPTGEESRSQSSHGYGVRNIGERLRLYYGEAYGLEYRSVVGKGTAVSLRIPLR